MNGSGQRRGPSGLGGNPRLSTGFSAGWAIYLIVIAASIAGAGAHPHHGTAGSRLSAAAAAAGSPSAATGVSGDGDLRFHVLYTSAHLPEAAVSVLESAHGGFAVDRRAGRGETYFALPGAGIVQISPDFKSIRMLETDGAMRDANLHNTTLWFDSSGTGFLTFPAEADGRIFTTTLGGRLVHTLEMPGGEDHFDEPTVDNYFGVQGKFSPTDVEYLQGLFYVTTGYSSLDYVLTARVLGTNPFRAVWNDLVFGGRGDGPGKFGTGHGITLSRDETRLDVADRARSEIDRFTRYGHYRSTWRMPIGSFPCDIDYSEDLAVVGCLYGPDRRRGAPVYLLDEGRVVSTIMIRDELGLEKFQHIHNAVLRKVEGRYYIIVQAWNPGDFAILEQVR